MKLIQTFIFGNIYISLCAVVMCAYTFLTFQIKPDIVFLLFVFFATLTSYSFHWFMTPDVHSPSERYSWVNNNKTLLLSFLIVSITVSLILIYILRSHILLLSGIAAFTFFYSASKIPFIPFTFLKKIIIGKTIYLALAWTIVTAVLPLIIYKKEWEPANTLFMINRFLLIYPICVLFDYRDKEEDKKQNIKNIVGLLNLKMLRIFYYACLTLFFISVIILFNYNFAADEVVILAIPGVLLLFTYNYSIQTKSDYWYYFYLDGLMMLSGVLFFLYINFR